MTKPTARARRTRVRDGSSSRCWHQGGPLARPHPKDRTGGRGVAGNDAGDDLARRRTHGLIGEEATEHGRAKRRRGNGVELTAGSLAVSLGSGRPLRRRIRPRGSPDINGDEDDGVAFCCSWSCVRRRGEEEQDDRARGYGGWTRGSR